MSLCLYSFQMLSGLEHDTCQVNLIFSCRIFDKCQHFIQDPISISNHRCICFYCSERKYMFLPFCSHHLSMAAVRLCSVLARPCIFFLGLFLPCSYKILVPEHFFLHFDESFSHCCLSVNLNSGCHMSILSSPLHLLSRSSFPRQ